MNWYRHPFSESRFLLSVPYFNNFHWFFKESVVKNVSLNWNAGMFCKQFTFEMFKIMKLALSVVSVWLNLSWY